MSTCEPESEHDRTYRFTLEVSATHRTWIWQPYRRSDGTVAGREPLEPEDRERISVSEPEQERLCAWLERKMVAWPKR